MLTEALLTWDLPAMTVLLIIMALIFLLGWPLEWVPIVLIIVPILIPALDKLGINLTWFGILVAVNLQTAWLSPPVALFCLLPERCGAGVGSEGHLLWHDAVHGHPAHRSDSHPPIPTDRIVAA